MVINEYTNSTAHNVQRIQAVRSEMTPGSEQFDQGTAPDQSSSTGSCKTDTDVTVRI